MSDDGLARAARTRRLHNSRFDRKCGDRGYGCGRRAGDKTPVEQEMTCFNGSGKLTQDANT